MPEIRNGNVDKDISVNLYTIGPRQTKVTPFYSWDPKAEILDHENELWMFDLTAEPWMDAIVGSTIIKIPEGTNMLEVWNGSANLIRIYNYKKDLVTPAPTEADPNAKKKNIPYLIPGYGVRYIPALSGRVWQIEVVGSVNAGELAISFSSKIDLSSR